MDMKTLLIGMLIGFALAVVAIVVLNIVKPEWVSRKLSKASKELSEELIKRGILLVDLEDKLKGSIARVERLAQDLAARVKAAGDVADALERLKKGA